jgi:splicing factor 3A subunit 3
VLQTYEEMLAELEEGEEAAVEEEEDEEEYVYNPLKLPLGWDGKPIPYWLYKLHGLNMEFKCEICGNYRSAKGAS